MPKELPRGCGRHFKLQDAQHAVIVQTMCVRACVLACLSVCVCVCVCVRATKKSHLEITESRWRFL